MNFSIHQTNRLILLLYQKNEYDYWTPQDKGGKDGKGKGKKDGKGKGKKGSKTGKGNHQWEKTAAEAIQELTDLGLEGETLKGILDPHINQNEETRDNRFAQAEKDSNTGRYVFKYATGCKEETIKSWLVKNNYLKV